MILPSGLIHKHGTVYCTYLGVSAIIKKKTLLPLQTV